MLLENSASSDRTTHTPEFTGRLRPARQAQIPAGLINYRFIFLGSLALEYTCSTSGTRLRWADIRVVRERLRGAMNIRRKEFIAEIRRLKRELADVSGRLGELEELANPTRSIATIVTIVPEENPFDEDENSFAAKVASGMSKVRLNK